MMSRKHVTNFRGDGCTPNDKIKIKDEPETPIEEDFGYNLDPFEDNLPMRKSMSMNDLNLRDYDKPMNMEYDSSKVDDQRRPSCQSLELWKSKTKFVSVAEAIYHYQTDTPNRFHSTRPQIFRSQCFNGRAALTRPQSPMLRCKSRSRPLHILSQREREELELEEIKRYKIKANPVPKSVIEGTQTLPVVPKKPITIPEPFKLTEVHKKLISPEQVPAFKARPAPKHVLEKPFIPVKLPVSVTKPVSPKLHHKKINSEECLLTANNVANCKKSTEQVGESVRHGPIIVKPFSFEKRDEELKKRKEERIRLQIEEEKRQASSFKAHPLPVAVKKRMHSATIKGGSSNSSDNKENNVKFEARPPTVLYKEPFKPILQPPAIITPVPFELTLEKRALDREKFDRQLKEKEAEQVRLRQLREKEEKEMEARAKAEIRAKSVHHAKPAPTTLQPFLPEKSLIPITIPETPKFIRRLNQK